MGVFYSVNMLFSESKNIKKSVKEVLEHEKFAKMTDVQEKTLKEPNSDLIVQAPTGSGKTLCFVIPLANFLIDSPTKGVKALIILPTRELSIQIKEVADKFGINNEIFMGGGDSPINIIKENTNLIIGTPGRLLYLMKDQASHFSRLKYLILDEADKLLSQGFESQLQAIFNYIPKKNRRTLMFSATIDASVRKLAVKLGNFKEIISGENKIPENLKIRYLKVTSNLKLKVMGTIYKQKTIVFFSTCAEVDFFYEILIKNSLFNTKVVKLHGRLDQTRRTEIHNEIKNLEQFLLLTTDVSARGIDFKSANLVIHFDVPKDSSNILHRSGRVGRNGESGESVLFLMPNETKYLNYLKLKYQEVKLENFDMENINNIFNTYENLEKPPELIKLGATAFVSYIRSYKEHFVNYILNYKDLDLEQLKETFCLHKLPKMSEIASIKKAQQKHQ
ncbi:hypothetical protein NUSPORA_02230 [Nucleospora cyclopteri]